MGLLEWFVAQAKLQTPERLSVVGPEKRSNKTIAVGYRVNSKSHASGTGRRVYFEFDREMEKCPPPGTGGKEDT